LKTALFTNWTNEDFTGYWDGKGKTISAGKSLWMPDYLAKHFAKHLTNRELLRTDDKGNLVYKNGDKFTSPKKPEQVPLFTELFNKAYKSDETEEMGTEKDDIDALIDSANKNKQEKSLKDQVVEEQKNPDPLKPQTVLSPDFDNEDEEEE